MNTEDTTLQMPLREPRMGRGDGPAPTVGGDVDLLLQDTDGEMAMLKELMMDFAATLGLSAP